MEQLWILCSNNYIAMVLRGKQNTFYKKFLYQVITNGNR